MTPQERALRETQVSLERQKLQLELRYQAEAEKLRMAAEEDLVNRFRSSLRAPSRTPAKPRAPAPAPANPFRRRLQLKELLPPLPHGSPFWLLGGQSGCR